MGKKFKSGYTLTELAVAIAFISILLLTIATVTLNLANMYHRGTTLKSINTIGLELIDEFKSAVSASPTFDYHTKCAKYTNNGQKQNCEESKALLFVFQEWTNENMTDDKKIKKNETEILAENTQSFGIFCTGKYTYVWNTGYVLGQEDEYTQSSKLYSGGEKVNEDIFSLKKYEDPGGTVCKNNLKDEEYKLTESLSIEEGLKEINSELITTKDIAIYNFRVDKPVQIEDSSKGTMFIMHLVLGSISGGVEVNTGYAGCDVEATAEKGSYDLSHCAAYQFDFSQRIQNGQ